MCDLSSSTTDRAECDKVKQVCVCVCVTSGAVSRMTLRACTMAEAKRKSRSWFSMSARAQKTLWGPSRRDSLRSMREPRLCSNRPPSGPRNLHHNCCSCQHRCGHILALQTDSLHVANICDATTGISLMPLVMPLQLFAALCQAVVAPCVCQRAKLTANSLMLCE